MARGIKWIKKYDPPDKASARTINNISSKFLHTVWNNLILILWKSSYRWQNCLYPVWNWQLASWKTWFTKSVRKLLCGVQLVISSMKLLLEMTTDVLNRIAVRWIRIWRISFCVVTQNTKSWPIALMNGTITVWINIPRYR